MMVIHGGSYDDAWEECLGIFSDEKWVQMMVDEFNEKFPYMAEFVEVELDSDRDIFARFDDFKQDGEKRIRAYWKDFEKKKRNKETIKYICDTLEVSEKFVMDTLKIK